MVAVKVHQIHATDKGLGIHPDQGFDHLGRRVLGVQADLPHPILRTFFLDVKILAQRGLAGQHLDDAAGILHQIVRIAVGHFLFRDVIPDLLARDHKGLLDGLLRLPADEQGLFEVQGPVTGLYSPAFLMGELLFELGGKRLQGVITLFEISHEIGGLRP